MRMRYYDKMTLLCMSVAFSFLYAHASLANYRDDFPDFAGILIDHDETWGKDGQYVFDKEVRIVDGAVLTIEPGTHISFKRDQDGNAISLGIFGGGILAVGTEADPIIFQRADDNGAFTINFSHSNNEASVFQYVHFLRGGDEWDVEVCSDCQQSFLEKALSPRVFAATQKVGIAAFQYGFGKLIIENSVFKDSVFEDIWADRSRVNDYIDDEGNIHPNTSLFRVKDSDFSGSAMVPALTVRDSSCDNYTSFCRRKITFENDWYASSSGPVVGTNPLGTGKRIDDDINLNGWSPRMYFCLENCHSSVLFLPGLEASRLYRGDEQLWEPNGDADAEKLLLNEDGKSRDPDIYADSAIDNAYVSVKGDIYKSFLDDLDRWKEQERVIDDYAVGAYDWRLSLDDILADEWIENTLRDLAQRSRTGKVTIIAHSNGGLLAKALIKKLGDDEAKKLIDNLVLIAVPQSGTPQAIGAILHGYEQGLPVSWMSYSLSPRAARTLANNMPGAYHLLPSQTYFSGEGSGVETPTITFEDGTLTDGFIGKYDHEIDNADELQDFLSDNQGKIAPDSEDIVSPSTSNTGLLSYGRDLHQSLDDMTIPEPIHVYQIAGFGEETLGTIKYWTDEKCIVQTGNGHCAGSVPKLAYTPDKFVDGDGTVVAPSALAMMSANISNVKRYWVDLKKYDTYFTLERKHADIFEVDQLRSFIRDTIVVGSSGTYPKYISASEPPTSSEKRLRYYLHSPLALSVKDSDNHIVSASISDIPGARYKRFGEVQYISVPAAVHPTVVLDGETEGSFTLEVREMEGETITAETTFAAIPNTADTQVTMDFPDGTLEHAEPLVINYDGQGEPELSLEPKIGEVVTTEQTNTDIVPPTTTVTLSGTQGTNKWYTSDVMVTLAATDNKGGSGVDKTKYSIDNGTTWTPYTDPLTISAEGTMLLQYRSVGKTGNQEETKIETIKIDKTKPVITGTALPAANANGWNTTDVEVRFVCIDSGAHQSGIETDTVVGNTLTAEGKNQSVTNTGECIDKAGNKAGATTVSGINTDKTAPEAKITFNPTTQKLDISGTDNLSNVSVVIVDKSDLIVSNKKFKNIKPWFGRWFDRHKRNLPDMLATLTNEAGHTTSLAFEKQENKNFSFVRLLSIGYDESEDQPLKDVSLGYVWQVDRKGRYTDFSSSLISGDKSLTSAYLSKQNKTLILEQTKRHFPNLINIDGMVVPYVESEKGKINVRY